MADIEKIYSDSERTIQIYPQTHERAVVDNNGTTAETKFQMITDLVNQKQMAVGAVPSDLTPTLNSAHWVPSGSLFNSMFLYGDNEFDITKAESTNPSSSNFSVVFDTQNETMTVSSKINIQGTNIAGGLKCDFLVTGKKYKFSFDYTNNISDAIIFKDSYVSDTIPVGSGSISFIVTNQGGSLYVRIPQNTPANTSFILSNISIVSVESVKKIVENQQERLDVDENEIFVLKKDTTSKPIVISYSSMTQNAAIVSPTTKQWRRDNENDYWHYYFRRTSEMKAISIQGNGTENSYITFVKTYNYDGVPTGTPDYCDGYTGPISFSLSSAPQDAILIPDDCNFIIVNKSYYHGYPLPESMYIGYNLNSVVSYDEKTILTHKVQMEVGAINTNTGENMTFSLDATERQGFATEDGYAYKTENGEFVSWRNVGMIEVEGGEYTISFDNGDMCRVILFDLSRQFLRSAEYGAEDDVSSAVVNTDGARYLRFMILKKSESYPNAPYYIRITEPKVFVSGLFPNGLNIAKLGRQNRLNSLTPTDTIITPVWIENTFSTNASTTNLQDTGEWHIDFGLIRFPDNYDPDGKPVRLIIWCHGGAPRYNPVYYGDSNYSYPGTVNSTPSNFEQTVHLVPTLFLAEGYAVMDMDGVFAIFNEKADENGTRPNSLRQTAHCYQAAYDYVVRNYNICTDGVLLGGISFGGSKALQIILHSHIPVLAAALESPYVCETRMWWGVYRTLLGRSVGVDGFHYNLVGVEDLELIEEVYNKMLVASPILGACHVKKEDFFATVENVSFGGSETESDILEWTKKVVYKWAARFDVPIKMWCCTADATSVPDVNGKMLYAVGSNGGSDIELRMITGGSHTPSTTSGTSVTVSNYVTKYGQTLATVPLVYAEAIRFWRRYEQNY